MATKLLTEGRGPLQGVDVESIIRNAYGSDAQLREDPEGISAKLIVKAAHEGSSEEGYDVVDRIVEVHEE